jgi:hypothetical protein
MGTIVILHLKIIIILEGINLLKFINQYALI